MIKNLPFRLDIEKEYQNRMYSVNSNDLQTVKFTFTVTDNGIPLDLSGLTVRIAIYKPDKKAVWQDCTITNASKGECEVILDNQAYIKKGEHEAELMLSKGDKTVAVTQKFHYRAVQGIMSNNSLKSENVLGPIDEKLSEVENLIKDIRENGTGVDAKARQDIQTVTTQLAESTNFTQSITLSVSEKNVSDLVPNADEPLNIPTYDGSGDTTHPSALYFKDGWNGYKFWLAHTPYADVTLENPCIVASNDSKTWVEPATNPIAPLDVSKHDYQSDPHIFMVGNKMELWFRGTKGGLTEIFRMTTTDGKNWTPREKLMDNQSFEMVRSPAIRYINGKYCMWYTTDSNDLKYGESTGAKNWTNVRKLNIPLDPNYFFWHQDVIVENGKYELFVHCKTQDTLSSAIFYSESKDNVDWAVSRKIMIPGVGSGRLDNKNLYRPAVVMVDDMYYMYYGTINSGDVDKLALTKGKSPLLFNGKDTKNRVQVKYERTGTNAYTLLDTIDKFKADTITVTKITSAFAQEHGFPGGAAGTLTTDNSIASSAAFEGYFAKQEYKLMYSDTKYERYVQANGKWSAFVNSATKKIQQTISLEAATINPNGQFSKRIQIVGATLGDIAIANPRVTIEPNLTFNVFVNELNYILLRVYNVSTTAVNMVARDWEIAIIKK